MSLASCLASPLCAVTLAAVLVPTATASVTAPQDRQEAEERPPQLVTRVYSLRPLVAEARAAAQQSSAVTIELVGQFVPDKPEQQAQQVAGVSMPAAAADPNEVVSQVVSIILETIDSDTWRDNGGEPGSITYLPVNQRLVVTHTEQVQARVAQLIHDLQDRKVVTVEARLVRLPDAQVEAQVEIVEGTAVWQGELALDVKPVAEVRFSGFEGQTHRAGDGKVVGYFRSVQPVVAASAVAYQPEVDQVNTGLTLTVTPVLSEDGSHVTLEVTGEYALMPFGGESVSQTRPTSGDPVLPDRITVDRSVVQSALRVRVGQWVLVGTVGASRDGQPNEEAPLHLLLRIETGRGAEAPPRE